MNFFIFFKIITDGITDGMSVGNSIGKSVGNKKYYCRRIYRRNEAGNFIFFIFDGFTDGQKITNEIFTDGAFLSVILSVKLLNLVVEV